MYKIMIILFSSFLLFFNVQHVLAVQPKKDVISNFTMALFQEDNMLARSYLDKDVHLPKIRENTKITGISGLPSPKENVKVIIAYFKAENGNPNRIGFIWEVTYTKDKITNIRVVYDGSNPLMNEYSLKFPIH
jgi:hypothetical protein